MKSFLAIASAAMAIQTATTTTTTLASALSAPTNVLIRAEPRGWSNISFHKLPTAASALRCGADQHGYGATAGVVVDDDGGHSASPVVSLAECRQMLNRTLMGNGTWDVVGFGDDGRWSWLSAAYSCTFFVAPVPGTEGMNFTIGSEDVRNTVSFVIDHFDSGDGTLNVTRGFISGCPGATSDVEWLIYDRQNQPIGLPPR